MLKLFSNRSVIAAKALCANNRRQQARSRSVSYATTTKKYEELYQQSINNPEKFWGTAAEQSITWFKPFDQVLDKSNPPFYRWFKGGIMNTCYNCLDLQVQNGRGEQTALIWDSPVSNSIKKITECAVIGVEDAIKGEVPLGLVVLKSGVHRDHKLIVNECIERVREHVGPVAAFRKCVVVNQLPKTRSGKILRATLRQIANSLDFKVPPTIDNASALEHVIERLNTIGHAQKHKAK